MNARSKFVFHVILSLAVFSSGLAALVYEVVFMRKLTLVFGTTVYSVSCVLASFMAGLSLGSWLLGRYVGKFKNLLQWYGFIEFGIGGSAYLISILIPKIELLYPILFSSVTQRPLFFTFIQFIFCFLLLLPPTVLMGATFPLVTHLLVSDERELGRKVGAFYAINTFGGAIGALLASYLLIPLLGVSGTIEAAVMINGVIGAIMLILSSATANIAPYSPCPQNLAKSQVPLLSPLLKKGVMASFALSGFFALAYEVLWTRVLTAVIGHSVYAFSIILSSFLLGIVLGSSWISRKMDSQKTNRNLFQMLVFFHLLLASFVLLTIPFFDGLPFLFKHLHRWFSQHFGWFQLAQFFLCFFVIFVPTFFFGAIFPLVNRLLFDNSSQPVGAAVGKLYALNTMGAIAGSLVSGFVFIPLFGGIQLALRAIASAHFLMGAILIWILPTLSFSKKAVIAICFSGVLFLTAFFEKAWDPALLYSGMYLYAPKYSDNLNDFKKGLRQGKILFHKEGIHATVTVKDFHKDWLVLFINGKGDASSREWPESDFASQCLLAHVPSLLHPNPRSVAVIGLGSGATVGAALSYPLQEIDVIEISPEVIEASRLFSRANDHALDDLRVRLIVQDARQYLLATQKRYDLILSEPSNPWITGISNLFTKDHYEILKTRLEPGGIVAQWFHYYSMNETDFKIALKTFSSVFRYVTLWDVHYASRFAIGDIILIGSETPLRPSRQEIEKRMKSPRIHAALSRIGRGDFHRLIDLYMMDEIDLHDYTRGMPLNTDDFPMIEFSAPKSLVLDSENKYRIRNGFELYKFSKRFGSFDR